MAIYPTYITRVSMGLWVKDEPSFMPSMLAHGVRDQEIIGWLGVKCEHGLGFRIKPNGHKGLSYSCMVGWQRESSHPCSTENCVSRARMCYFGIGDSPTANLLQDRTTRWSVGMGCSAGRACSHCPLDTGDARGQSHAERVRVTHRNERETFLSQLLGEGEGYGRRDRGRAGTTWPDRW